MTYNGTTLAIDPGKDHVGMALFKGVDIINLGYVKATNQYELAGKVALEFALWLGKSNTVVDILVLENQQIYGNGRGKGDPNDLLPLSFVCGAISATIPHRQLLHPKAREWKGSVPKQIYTGRLLRYMSLHYEEHFKALSQYNAKQLSDVVDAFGLGLWSLGLEP
jgi:hypothetical protein